MSDLIGCYEALIMALERRLWLKCGDLERITKSDCAQSIEIAKSLGIPLVREDDRVYSKNLAPINERTFCIVDIETSGFSPESNDIIEIAAIKYRGGETLDRFESYCYAREIPEKITEITGIDESMTANAPTLAQILPRFKAFLEDSVFMAHNVSFDFNFINAKLESHHLPIMKNSTICTLRLARKTINAPKYGLGYLNEYLGINYPVRHRAFADCQIALKVFEESLSSLPPKIRNVSDLLDFMA